MEFDPGRTEYLEFVVRDGLRHRNRGALDIVNSILKACVSGALKTHILYKCNLSSRQVGQYLEFLLKQGLLARRVDNMLSREIYTATPRGRHFVALYEDLCKTLVEAGD